MNRLSTGFESLHRTQVDINKEASKLLYILGDMDSERWGQRERSFYEEILDRSPANFTERQVTWLRDIKDRYL